MRCTTCPLVLPCWGGTLDVEAQATLCTRCLRFLIPAADLPERAHERVRYYVLQCEQRNVNHIRRQLKNPFPLYGQDIDDPGPGLKHRLHVGVCLICSGLIGSIQGTYIDLDEELAADAEVDTNLFGLRGRPK